MGVSRRDFLKIVGVAGAGALAGCASEAPRKIVPYLIPEHDLVPGQATWYATVCRECPAGCGMLVKTVEGRAIKVEGNPDHPVSRGGLCARGQASLQGLYNPDRVKQPLQKAADGTLRPVLWEEAERVLAAALAQAAAQKRQIAFISPLLTGSLDRLIDLWLEAMGGGVRLRYEAVSYESLREANRIAFGAAEIPAYRIDKAKLLLSFGADFLETWISPVEHARQFAAMRRYRDGEMGRFVYLGPRLSLTAANSDEWIATRPGTELFVALAMIRVILDEGLGASLPATETAALKALVAEFAPAAVAEKVGIAADQVRVLARAFALQRPSLALVDARGTNGTETCLAVTLLNYVAGNIGETIRFGAGSAAGGVSRYGEMRRLIEAMEKGEIAVLLLAGVNPLFTVPEAGRLREALEKVSLVVSVGSFLDETAASAAHLVLPESTFLESWGDYEPWAGVRGLQQPVMEPLYDTRSLGEILLSVAARAQKGQKLPWDSFYSFLRSEWLGFYRKLEPRGDFETFWFEAVRRGGDFREASTRRVRLRPEALRFEFHRPSFRGEAAGLVLVPYPSLFFYDGRTANRPWLQELPDPLTQYVWDSWLEVHPEDAKRLGIKTHDLVRVKSLAGEVELAAHVTAGVREGSVAVGVGQGHRAYGRYAEKIGVNVLPLLAGDPEALSEALVWVGTRVTVSPMGGRHRLVSTAGSDRSHGRDIARAVSLTALQRGEEKEAPHALKQMYPDHDHPRHRWGMVIDLNACIGCSACVVACAAENNVPVVGKKQVDIGREMSWIRIQRYDEGGSGPPDHRFIPMLCQQCDRAPCEPVCPVYATYHNPEGLNAQVYNRCVGTRYCSNNCPYKVRRFNWFQHDWPEPLNLQLNPDVTVRGMGVIEKCTFCVQRIRAGELAAKAENRPVRDGEIVPACAQSCPTRAIVFGDLQDPQSEVAKLAKDPRAYRVLEHLNTQPAITYLKKVKHE